MKTAKGNDKLGKENCIVVSRPVGDTCPPSCEFLGSRCYAEQLKKYIRRSPCWYAESNHGKKQDPFHASQCREKGKVYVGMNGRLLQEWL